MSRGTSCVIRQTQTIIPLESYKKSSISGNHTHLLSTHLCPVILFCSLIFLYLFQNVYAGKRLHSYKKNLVCSRITISENATPKNLSLAMNPWCNCKKQEYQVFHSIIIVICSTSTISVNAGVLLKRDIFRPILHL